MQHTKNSVNKTTVSPTEVTEGPIIGVWEGLNIWENCPRAIWMKMGIPIDVCMLN